MFLFVFTKYASARPCFGPLQSYHRISIAERIALPNILFILGKTMQMGGTGGGNAGASCVCVVTLYSCVCTDGRKARLYIFIQIQVKRPNRPFNLNLDKDQMVKVQDTQAAVRLGRCWGVAVGAVVRSIEEH